MGLEDHEDKPKIQVTMFVMRPIQNEDLESFIQLAFKAKIGITSLPKNRQKLHTILQSSVNSFAKNATAPGKEVYLFLLENIVTKEVGGVSGIYATTGEDHPLHFFKTQTVPLEKTFPEAPENFTVLEPVTCVSGPTEICSLFLDPDFRREGLGKLLSLSRFLFMANFPERFTKTVFALLRSYIDTEEENPFWNHVGRHFLDISFKELMKRKDEGLNVFPPALAKYPLLVPLLHHDAKKALGNVHKNTLPALYILQKQGFMFTGEVDALDGGPKVEAERSHIKTIQNSLIAEVSGFTKIAEQPNYLISNTTIDFRCCLGYVEKKGEKILLNKNVAGALNVKVGDHIRFSPIEEHG